MKTKTRKKGREKEIWNDTFKIFDIYRLSSRGKWIPKYNKLLSELTRHEMKKK